MEPKVDDSEWTAPDGSFTKVVFNKGFGFFTPQLGSVCKVKVIGDERSVVQPLDDDAVKEIVIGEADSEIDKVVEACVKTMKEEEVCELVVSKSVEEEEDASPTSCGGGSPVDAGEEGETEESVRSGPDAGDAGEGDGERGGGGTTSVTLRLLAFTREPEIWEMSITEKWRRASRHKAKGVELYSAGKIKWAFGRFGVALRYVVSLEHDIPPEHNCDEQGMDIRGLKVSCYLNLAACQLKHRNYSDVIVNCTRALDLEPDNLKALFRRGVALIHVQEYERAREDLDRVSEMEPEHPAVAKQQRKLRARVQRLNAYYADAMKKMFS